MNNIFIKKFIPAIIKKGRWGFKVIVFTFNYTILNKIYTAIFFIMYKKNAKQINIKLKILNSLRLAFFLYFFIRLMVIKNSFIGGLLEFNKLDFNQKINIQIAILIGCIIFTFFVYKYALRLVYFIIKNLLFFSLNPLLSSWQCTYINMRWLKAYGIISTIAIQLLVFHRTIPFLLFSIAVYNQSEFMLTVLSLMIILRIVNNFIMAPFVYNKNLERGLLIYSREERANDYNLLFYKKNMSKKNTYFVYNQNFNDNNYYLTTLPEPIIKLKHSAGIIIVKPFIYLLSKFLNISNVAKINSYVKKRFKMDTKYYKFYPAMNINRYPLFIRDFFRMSLRNTYSKK